MKKILITGGAGFIGSHTVVAVHQSGGIPVLIDNFSNSEKSVLKGIEGICLQEFPCHEGDCTDPEFLDRVFEEEKSIAGVIHFAAYKSVNESVEKPEMYYRNNIGSLLTLLEAMKKHNVTGLIFSSSCTVYGTPDRCPVSEDAPIKETPSPYGKTKQMCEYILQDVVKSSREIKCVALRYFNPIGAHPSGLIGELPIGVPNNLVPYITQSACGVRGRLTIFGDDYQTADGSCVRDFIHVVDLAEAHVKALGYLDTVKAGRCYEIFNLGTGRGHSVKEVVNAFERVTGQELNYVIGKRRPGDVEAVYADARRADRLMGWKAQLTLDQALKDAWHWQQKLQDRH
jgi:UDP-glucose 4-epimerase